MIRYNKRIRSILNFVEQYGFITSKICGLLFYKDCKYSLDMGRRVLNKLCANKDLVANQMKYGKELVYQFKKNDVSDHKYYLLNLYAEINKLVDNIEYFKLEEIWGDKRSDGHIIFSNMVNNEIITKAFLIEFDKFHKTPKNKYNELYEKCFVQKWYKDNFNQDDYFPDIIVINYNGVANLDEGEYSVIGLDYKFNGLLQKVIL